MDEIEVINGTSTKRVSVETARGRATVFWPMAGQYDVDLETGELLSQVLAVNGIFSVDCMTGRVQGTRCSVVTEDLPRLELLTPGATLRLQHDHMSNGDCMRVEVQVVDALPSEGTLKIYVRPERGMNHVGRTYRTGWRVPDATLKKLRAMTGVRMSRAS